MFASLLSFFQGVKTSSYFPWLGGVLAAKFGFIYQKIVQMGVDKFTPPALIDRIVFSNSLCFFGTLINLVLAYINFAKGYYYMLAPNGVYFLAAAVCYYFNYRHHYLAGRVVLLCLVYLALLVSGLIQGPVIEIEHFFLPLGILGFSLFHREERRYSFGFLGFSLLAYFFLVNQDGPFLKVSAYPFSDHDKISNQLGYLALFAACLLALSNSFERASKLIDEQRNRLNEERRLAAFGMIVGNVAHEINSPLAALDVQLFHLDSLLKKGALSNEEIIGRTDRMRKISRRLSVIVRSLKFISGQDVGDSPVKSPIGTVIDSALDLTRDRMEKEGVSFRSEMKFNLQEIACRPVALSQVFLNLLNNAVDAVENLSSEKRWILLEDAKIDDRLVISLTDGGAISSEEAREGLFRNFYTTKPAGRGTGLGLSISRETVEGHGGALWFDSKSPNTRFVIELPLPKEVV